MIGLFVCLAFALDGAEGRFADLGRAICAAEETCSVTLASQKFLSAVENICNKLEIPTLEGYGIEKDKFFEVIDKVARDAMDSKSPQNTQKEITTQRR